LHTRQLGAVANEEEHAQVTRELSRLTDETRRMSNGLKSAIKRLEADTAKRPPGDPDTNVRRTQVGAVKNRCGANSPTELTAQLHGGHPELPARRAGQPQKAPPTHGAPDQDRCVRVMHPALRLAVKPEASQAEIDAAVNNDNGQGDRIFEQAVRRRARKRV